MKVVLKADVKGTGKKDQMVEVSDGYARNFLLPRGLAVAANAAAVNEVKTKESAKRHHAEVELEQARQTARTLAERLEFAPGSALLTQPAPRTEKSYDF